MRLISTLHSGFVVFLTIKLGSGLLAYRVVNTVRFQLKRGETKENANAKQQNNQEVPATINFQ